MSAIVATTSPLAVRSDVTVRVATMADVPFMDALQKAHAKQLGYFPTKQFEGYIAQGAVLIAEGLFEVGGLKLDETSNPQTLKPQTTRNSVGYVIAKDRYLKRDELGVIYQLCVAPGNQRKQVGAALVKAVFERSAYGCKLYCCWCAQDIEANRFWESMGFIPIAFRAGSDKKKRVHIFWQRRINADDTGERATPYWFPAKTESGAIREDRLVFPIPPGTHWTEVKAVQLREDRVSGVGFRVSGEEQKRLSTASRNPNPETRTPTPSARPRVQFGPPPATPETAPESAVVVVAGSAKPKREKKPKTKADPKLIAAARELRDRYLEHVNQDGGMPTSRGKYDVARTVAAAATASVPLLPAA